jgi:hypothetical protein
MKKFLFDNVIDKFLRQPHDVAENDFYNPLNLK